MIRRYDSQCRHVRSEQLSLALGQGHPIRPSLRRAFQERVVDIGDVLHECDREARIPPRPVEQIECQIGGSVAKVGCVIRRDTAHVHARPIIRTDR